MDSLFVNHVFAKDNFVFVLRCVSLGILKWASDSSFSGASNYLWI